MKKPSDIVQELDNLLAAHRFGPLDKEQRDLLLDAIRVGDIVTYSKPDGEAEINARFEVLEINTNAEGQTRVQIEDTEPISKGGELHGNELVDLADIRHVKSHEEGAK